MKRFAFLSCVKSGIALLGFAVSVCALAAEDLVYRATDSKSDDLVVNLLKLVVAKSGQNYKVTPATEELTDERAMAELESGGIDVYWTMTSKANEEKMLPIRLPVDKGLLGYRIFLIRKGEQHRFESINAIKDFKGLYAGQGGGWPDTIILKDAGLDVVTTVKYKNLFPMLDGSRFDYFPRGINEPWGELVTWAQYPLTVEENIVLKYPTALYFFVRSGNVKVARMIEEGFEAAIQDGSFDEMFYSSKVISDMVKNSNLRSRRIISINNNLLSDKTPLDRKELWFDINSPYLAK